MYQCETEMQDVMQMCSNFDANKSTKGASKLRRDLINGEIANLRDLLPLPSSTRQRLSQLQLMALVCVYVRKANYFQQVFKRYNELGHPYSTPNIGFSKALSGFLIMMTQNGKLLYISDNAAEYLGHSMEDLLIHGDSVYDIIDKADHGTVQNELLRSTNMQNPPGEETRLFLCRMNVSRNARRQMRFGDQKVVLLQGHFLSYLPLCSRNEPVFVATCTPVAMPETRECVVQGATNIFTSIHAMDMKFMHIDRNGEYYLGYTRSEIGGVSWYKLIHWSYMREAQSKHRLISQSEQEKSCILLLKLQKRNGDWIWIHCVLQVKDSSDSSSSSSSSASNSSSQQQSQQHHQSVIVATNQVLSEREASVMRANAWLYHYYTVQTKLQYGLAYQEAAAAAASVGTSATGSTSHTGRFSATAAYFPTTQLLSYGSHLHHHSQLYHNSAHHHQDSNGAIGSSYGNGTASVVMSPSLQSPHSSSTSAYSSSGHHYHPYHHPHHNVHGATATAHEISLKESPLDFSIASATSGMYDFSTAAGYSSTGVVPPSYWPHHHHNPHFGYTTDTNGTSNRSASQASPLEGAAATHSGCTQKHHVASTWSIPSSLPPTTPSGNPPASIPSSTQQINNHSKSGNGSGHPLSSSKKKYSNLCPPSASNTNLSLNSSSGSSKGSKQSSSNASFPNGSSSSNKKRRKHSTVPETTLLASESSVEMSSSSARNFTSGIGESTCTTTSQPRGGSSSTLVSMISPYSYHHHGSRVRTLYKMLGTNDEEDADDDSLVIPNRSSNRMKEESMAITAWPLTPSPIWEGQTHRVPDLQQLYGDLRESHQHPYYSHYNSHGGLMMTPGVVGAAVNSSSAGASAEIMSPNAREQIHCVPSYQQNPYLQQFYHSNATGMVSSGMIGIGSNGANIQFSTSSNGTHGSLSVESGSPNKENRLPPTPDSSDPGESEENRPLKWETL